MLFDINNKKFIKTIKKDGIIKEIVDCSWAIHFPLTTVVYKHYQSFA